MFDIRRLVLLAALAATPFGTVVLSQQAPALGRTVLTGATVIDVVEGTTVPDAVIVIEGDRITALGDSTTPIPADVARVDLSGTFVITVFNRPPDGGTSNSVSLRVQAKWLSGGTGTDGLAP